MPDCSKQRARFYQIAGIQSSRTSSVGLRAAADEKSKVITMVNYGERLSVLEKLDAFVRVRLSDDRGAPVATPAEGNET